MFDPLVYLLFAVLGLTLFFGTVPLLIAIKLGDRPRLEKLLDLYTEVFAAGASAIIGALKIFRRREIPPEIPTKTLPPPEKESVGNPNLPKSLDRRDVKLIARLHPQHVPNRHDEKEDQDA